MERREKWRKKEGKKKEKRKLIMEGGERPETLPMELFRGTNEPAFPCRHRGR